MWAAFYANFKDASIREAPVSSKLVCIERAVKPMMSYRCSIWPPQKQVATEIDALQRKLIAIACPLTRRAGEDPEHYGRRKGRHASKLAQDAGPWSKYWFDRALKWDDHVQRDHSTCRWNHDLRNFHSIDWLRSQRSAFVAKNPMSLNSWTIFAGRTGTRAGPGKVQPRWQEAIEKVRSGLL